LSKHEDRAAAYRLLAQTEEARGLAALLPRVRESHERAAATWTSLAELEERMRDGFARRAAELQATLAAAAAG
jgi:hypothetical protein